jgi:hypothetical protein
MKSRAAALVGSFVFFWIAPITVAGWIPWYLTRWELGAPLFDGEASRSAGGLLVTIGAVCVIECFWRFAVRGLGTPAPIAPTRHLVVSGLYRHVRSSSCMEQSCGRSFSRSCWFTRNPRSSESLVPSMRRTNGMYLAGYPVSSLGVTQSLSEWHHASSGY